MKLKAYDSGEADDDEEESPGEAVVLLGFRAENLVFFHLVKRKKPIKEAMSFT